MKIAINKFDHFFSKKIIHKSEQLLQPGQQKQKSLLFSSGVLSDDKANVYVLKYSIRPHEQKIKQS